MKWWLPVCAGLLFGIAVHTRDIAANTNIENAQLLLLNQHLAAIEDLERKQDERGQRADRDADRLTMLSDALTAGRKK